MQTSFSNCLEKTNTKLSNIENEFFLSVQKENGIDKIENGIEAFEFIDKIFFKLDKSLQDGIKGIIDYFHTVDVFMDDIIRYKTKTPTIGTLYKLRVTLHKNMKDKKFYKLARRKVPVIMGLSIRYSGIVTILKNNEQYVKGLEQSIKDFDSFIDEILNSDKDKISIEVDDSNISAIGEITKSINKQLSTVTNTKVLRDRKEMREVVSNFKELDEVVKETLTLGKIYNMERLEKLYSINEDVINKLDTLYNAIKDKNVNMDKKTLKEFTNYIDNIAKLITANAFLYYLYFQLSDMLIATIKIIDVENEDHSFIDSIAYGLKIGYNTVVSFFKSI